MVCLRSYCMFMSYCMLVYLHCASWHSSATLTEGFPCFFLSCKANAEVKSAKMGHGPHSSIFVLFNVLFVCKYALYYSHRVATQLQLTNIWYHINWPQIGLEFQTCCEQRCFPYHVAEKVIWNTPQTLNVNESLLRLKAISRSYEVWWKAFTIHSEVWNLSLTILFSEALYIPISCTRNFDLFAKFWYCSKQTADAIASYTWRESRLVVSSSTLKSQGRAQRVRQCN